MDKKYILFAGVNGAGKSTLYKENGCCVRQRINSDELLIESGGNWKNASDQMKAMKEAVRRMDEYFSNGISFNQETTLTGRSIVKNIEKAKNLGYRVEVYYVGLKSADLAVERVAHRVKNGGHGIKEEDIRRRYSESLRNLPQILSLCDEVHIFDNTKNYVKVAFYEKGEEKFRKPCEWLDSAVPTRKELHIKELKQNGFQPNRKIISAMERIDKAHGKYTDLQTVSDIYKGKGKALTPEIKSCAKEIGDALKSQELSRVSYR